MDARLKPRVRLVRMRWYTELSLMFAPCGPRSDTLVMWMGRLYFMEEK